MNHCEKDFDHDDVWYLKDIYWGDEKIINRKLFIGYCLKCYNLVATRVETRESDKSVFYKTEIKSKAKGLMKKEQPRIVYTQQEFTSKTNHPKCDWTVGENTELKNQSNEVTQTRQYARNYSSGKGPMIRKTKFNIQKPKRTQAV